MGDAILYIRLEARISSSYDYAKGKMAARCSAFGAVWNAEESGPRFEGARVHVTFLSGIDGRMQKYAEEHRLEGACGNIEIARELAAESFEDIDGGDPITLPQIELWVGVDHVSFRLIEAGLAPGASGNPQASMTVHFGHRDFTRMVIPLESLDLSSKSSYPIVSFNVSCTRPAVEEEV